MADNVAITAGSGTNVAADEATFSGDTTKIQLVHRVSVTGSEGSKTVTDLDYNSGNKSDGTQRVVLATDQPNLSSGLNVTEASGSAIKTAVELIDDAVHADDATRGKSVLVGAVLDDASTIAITENQAGYLRMSSRRALLVEGVASGTNLNVIGAANSGVDIGDVTINNATGASAVNIQDGGNTITVDGTVTAANAAGDVASGTANSGNPVQVGVEAIAHGSNPSAVAAGSRTKLYASRAGIPFVIGGHPNIVTSTARRADADNGVTDGAIGPGTVNTGTKVVVTRITVTASNANTANVAVKIGFGASTLPSDSTTGAAGVLVDHEGVPPGGGFTVGDGSGILGIGADGEELRWTTDDPVGGHIICAVSFYTIES